jgi:hypothetical protein
MVYVSELVGLVQNLGDQIYCASPVEVSVNLTYFGFQWRALC